MSHRSIHVLLLPLLLASLQINAHHAALITLPKGARVEGVTHVAGTNFLAGSVTTGTIYLVDARTNLLTTAVRPPAGRVSLGMSVSGGRIFVAGGSPTGSFGGGGSGNSTTPSTFPTMFVYDVATGDVVTNCTLPNSVFLNDVHADGAHAYFTDSGGAAVYRLSISRLPTCTVKRIPLADAAFKGDGFRANGIVKYKGGLLIANTLLQTIFYIDLRYGNAVSQLLPDGSLPGADGLELVWERGVPHPRLYIAQNREQLVSEWVVTSSRRKVSLRKVRDITSPLFASPTTVAVGGKFLVVANFNFSAPFGVPAAAPFTLATVRI